MCVAAGSADGRGDGDFGGDGSLAKAADAGRDESLSRLVRSLEIATFEDMI